MVILFPLLAVYFVIGLILAVIEADIADLGKASIRDFVICWIAWPYIEWIIWRKCMNDHLGDLLDEENYEYKDVLAGGLPHCAALLEGQWWLIPIEFKFKDKVPYLDLNEARKIQEEELNTLEPYEMPIGEKTP